MEAQPDADVKDWSELPLDVLSLVFTKLGAIEVLMGAGLVCHSWLKAAMVPDVWRVVHIVRQKVVTGKSDRVLRAMVKVAVDHSDGRLEEFAAERFVTDELLKYIGDRSVSLKSLVLISCVDVSNKGFIDLVTNSPYLEELVVLNCPDVGGNAYEAAGEACPQLKYLTLRKGWHERRGGGAGITMMRELQELALVGRHHDGRIDCHHRRLPSPGVPLRVRLLQRRRRRRPASQVRQDQDADAPLRPGQAREVLQ